jgi:lipoyl(octanoyl) transferase
LTDWRLIDSGPCAATFNMALDEALAISVRNNTSPPVLRLYGWTVPSLTLGSFQKTDGINLVYCGTSQIPVVRRLTGGRAVLHDNELTYSFSAGYESGFSGRLMDVYMKIGAAFHLCFTKLGIDCTMRDRAKKGPGASGSPVCFESASIGEISFSGLKLIGSAQKRWPDAFMQQGSIPFSVDPVALYGIFGENRWNAGLNDFISDLDAIKMKKYLVSSFEESFDVSLSVSLPSQEELQLAKHLEAERYPDLTATPAGQTGIRCGSNRGKASQP